MPGETRQHGMQFLAPIAWRQGERASFVLQRRAVIGQDQSPIFAAAPELRDQPRGAAGMLGDSAADLGERAAQLWGDSVGERHLCNPVRKGQAQFSYAGRRRNRYI